MYIPVANVNVNLVIRQVPTISTVPIVATATPEAAPTIVNPVVTPTNGQVQPQQTGPATPAAAASNNQGSCIGSGSLAGAIVGSIIGTLLICYAIYAITNKNKNNAAGGGGAGARYAGDGGYNAGHGAGGFEGRKRGHAADVGSDGKKRYSGYDTKIEPAPHHRSRSRRRSTGGASRKSYSSYDRTTRPERVVYRD